MKCTLKFCLLLEYKECHIFDYTLLITYTHKLFTHATFSCFFLSVSVQLVISDIMVFCYVSTIWIYKLYYTSYIIQLIKIISDKTFNVRIPQNCPLVSVSRYNIILLQYQVNNKAPISSIPRTYRRCGILPRPRSVGEFGTRGSLGLVADARSLTKSAAQQTAVTDINKCPNKTLDKTNSKNKFQY